MIALIGSWAIAYFFTFLFMCRGKFEVLFTDLLAAMAQCVDTFKVGYSCSISDFVGDVLIVLIPIPMVSSVLHAAYYIYIANSGGIGLEVAPSNPNKAGGNDGVSYGHTRFSCIAGPYAVDDLGLQCWHGSYNG